MIDAAKLEIDTERDALSLFCYESKFLISNIIRNLKLEGREQNASASFPISLVQSFRVTPPNWLAQHLYEKRPKECQYPCSRF
jgi:hypothetical protein